MRGIQVFYETTTGAVRVESFENLTRNSAYRLELYFSRKGFPVILPVGTSIIAVAKPYPNASAVIKVGTWQRPSNRSLPYTATMLLTNEELGALFATDEFEEKSSIELTFELSFLTPEDGSADDASVKIPITVFNEYARASDYGAPDPADGENPYEQADARYLMRGVQSLSIGEIWQFLGNIGWVYRDALGGIEIQLPDGAPAFIPVQKVPTV